MRSISQWRTSRSERAVEEIRELYLHVEHKPCLSCGELCESQLEFADLNWGFPWAVCSGCDEDLIDEGDSFAEAG